MSWVIAVAVRQVHVAAGHRQRVWNGGRRRPPRARPPAAGEAIRVESLQGRVLHSLQCRALVLSDLACWPACDPSKRALTSLTQKSTEHAALSSKHSRICKRRCRWCAYCALVGVQSGIEQPSGDTLPALIRTCRSQKLLLCLWDLAVGHADDILPRVTGGGLQVARCEN